MPEAKSILEYNTEQGHLRPGRRGGGRLRLAGVMVVVFELAAAVVIASDPGRRGGRRLQLAGVTLAGVVVVGSSWPG